MPRAARMVLPGRPHHVTQRGNRRGPTFMCADDYAAYLAIAAQECAKARVEVWAYCLMPNHVHLIVVPSGEDGLSQAVGRTHLRYTYAINQREGWRGHLWQDRFASFAMDEAHLFRCIRYVGLNPVRAGLVRHATEWRWSSVLSHVCGVADPLLTHGPILDRLGLERETFFDSDLEEQDLTLFRRASAFGRPLVQAR